MKIIRIGTRESRLACVQAELVSNYIGQHCPGYEAQLVKLLTAGDRDLTKSLEEFGGKGAFVRELDIALVKGETDLSVHSLKDMPMEVSQAIPVIGYSRREDARDVLVLPRGADQYDGQRPIGCSSIRRRVQLKELYPQARVKPIRGNVPTRLKKLDAGEYGALVLAAAGLKRLGLSDRISRYFSAEEMVPAAGQGIVCVQGRQGRDYGYLDGFFDKEAKLCAVCERAFMAYLNGGCSLPAGVYARIGQEGKLHVLGMYWDEQKGVCKMAMTGEADRPEELGIRLAKALKGLE